MTSDNLNLTYDEHRELADYVIREIGPAAVASLALLFDTASREEKSVTLKAILEGDEDPVYDPMASVTEWHKAVGQKRHNEIEDHERPGLAELRRDLLSEEFWEVDEELANITGPYGSRARLAAELADLLYVAYGTAQVFGIDLPAVFGLVHEFNMRKVDAETGQVVRRSDGKILKPFGFQDLTEAEIEAVIN